MVLKMLNTLSLDIKNCRGQTYDNAANMAGKYKGLQARIKQLNESATFIPCSSHTLNLIGNCAAEACSAAVYYFDFLQNIYVFFSASTHRWNLLMNSFSDLKSKHIKRLCDTRWSARADAVSSLRCNYKSIKTVLIEISENSDEKPIAKLEAKKLAKYFDEYEIALLTVLWDKLLQRINSSSYALQQVKTNLWQGTNLLNSLCQFITEIRNYFQIIEQEANLLTDNIIYKESRIRKRKTFFDESSDNEGCLVGRESFKVETHNVICDRLITEISTRTTIYKEILKNFQLFFDHNMTNDDINECIDNLEKEYKNDIDVHYFSDEVHHFLKFIKEENVTCPFKMYKLVIDGLQSTFPNIETILKIFLTIPICNATGERSFSVLKRIKNYLRNSIGQKHLIDLSILFIENDIMQNITFENVIEKFAASKSRKVPLT